MAYGSRVPRQGRSLPWRAYQRRTRAESSTRARDYLLARPDRYAAAESPDGLARDWQQMSSMDRNGETRVIDPQAVQTASAVMPDDNGESRIEANLETLCSPVRVKIMRALAESELAAGDLALVIGRSRSATSQHLKVLREAGAVMSQRNGNVVKYRLADGTGPQLLAQVAMRLDRA